MTTNFLPENESTGVITLPKTSEIEAIYESIEQNAREQYKPQLLPKISPRLTMLVLAAVGVVGALIGSADLKVDTTVTFDTKLGQRTQPHWLVPKGAKVVRTDTGAGAIKGIGWLIGGLSGAALWHVAGNDERWQRFVGTLQTQWVEDYFKRNRAMVELQSMAALQMEKQRLDQEVNVDLAEQTWQFHQAIGYDPLVAQAAQNALPYGAPGTYDDVNDPGDKVEGETNQCLPCSELSAETSIEPVKRVNLSIEAANQTATKILNSLAGINTSIFLAAPTRCGKTHTLHKWLRDLTTRFPQADIYVISQKYEDFPGVAGDCLAVFNPLDIEESLRFLDLVYEKLLIRKSKPATEETYRDFPIKLILEDWFATHQCLTQKSNSAIWDAAAAKLGMIATVGGQYNVGYFICTQSFNIASSGVADSNIRLNLALLAQGLVRTSSNDEEQGSYGVIEQMLNNPKVIANKEARDRLSAGLKALIEPSMNQQTPIILSTIGNPVLGLMPKIIVSTVGAKGKQPKGDPSEPLPERGSGRFDFGGVPNENTPDPWEQSGTPKTLTDPETEQPGTPMEQRDRLLELLEQLLAGIVAGTVEKAVFASDFPLEQEDKMKLAKLVIAQNLGQEKTILLLWGVRRGGRNHVLYTEAREMLERLIKGDSDIA